MTGETIDNPILNAPYDAPERYFELSPQGPTGVVRDGRRPSESLIPIPPSRKGKKVSEGVQATFDAVSATNERRETNPLINDIRRTMELWRAREFPDVTGVTRKLLLHWSDAERDNRVLFCQREAVETAIYLHEVAKRRGQTDWHRRIADENAAYNEGLPRMALKMATGAGKTVVMAMIIAWQTANAETGAAGYSDRFLIVAPGITIRDRLRVLTPGDDGNYYDERELIPPDMQGTLNRAQITITNFHTFKRGNVKEIEGVNARTRRILNAHRTDDPFAESDAAMVARVLRDLSGRKGIVVLNDEAHHCYVDRAQEAKVEKAEREENEAARLWFHGLTAVKAHRGISQAYDLSATPYFLKGSGYPEGAIFPWTVSDFSLMDAIESGIVKIPRVPVDDDAVGENVTYLRLWDQVGAQLPKRTSGPDQPLPAELQGALKSLYRSYEKSWDDWIDRLRDSGAPPPVFIVVCNNTVVSKMVFDWVTEELPLFANVEDDAALARPVTILVDSARLEAGEALTPDFRAAAAGEIAEFQRYLRGRSQGVDVEDISDEDLLREVMNTVGKEGKLGADVRCVVSVAMLTEGWDANTVTHILGVRAFGSQLLCEQVVGRGLRRRSYALSEDGKFLPEYANVYGVPFQFIRDDGTGIDSPATPGVINHVGSVPGREHLRIEFPKVDGYRIEMPDEPYLQDLSDAPRFRIGPTTVPTWTDNSGIVGSGEQDRIDVSGVRAQEVAFDLARRILQVKVQGIDSDDVKPWKFGEVLTLTRAWLTRCVILDPGFAIGHITAIPELQVRAMDEIWATIARQAGNRRELLRPILRRHDPVGSTAGVSFDTRKQVEPVERSEISHVTLDGKGGNTWEQLLALRLDGHADVAAFAKNERLGFTIPYVHRGKAHAYIPDFLVRLSRRSYEPFDRTLIVEVSGSQKDPGMTSTKAQTARDQWCVAVNNHGGFGRWGYVELTNMNTARADLDAAIEALYEDRPIIGDPDRLDIDPRERRATA